LCFAGDCGRLGVGPVEQGPVLTLKLEDFAFQGIDLSHGGVSVRGAGAVAIDFLEGGGESFPFHAFRSQASLSSFHFIQEKIHRTNGPGAIRGRYTSLFDISYIMPSL
jgi:hypothetical protein